MGVASRRARPESNPKRERLCLARPVWFLVISRLRAFESSWQLSSARTTQAHGFAIQSGIRLFRLFDFDELILPDVRERLPRLRRGPPDFKRLDSCVLPQPDVLLHRV